MLSVLFFYFLIEKSKIDITKLLCRKVFLLPIIFLIYGILFGILLTKKEYEITKHIFWFSFVVLISILLFPVYKKAYIHNILWPITITIIGLYAIVLLFAYNQPSHLYANQYLPTFLFGVIMLIPLDTMYGGKKCDELFCLCVIIIALFNYFLISDTQHIIKTWNSSDGKYDYPARSLNLATRIIMDIIYFFAEIATQVETIY